MRVVIIGATGFIGRALTARLQRDGHHVVAVCRDPGRARGLLGDADLVGLSELEDAVARCDAVVNLAGENVLARRWSGSRKRVLEASRVGVTRRIADAVVAAERPPAVLVSASAVGFYGNSSAHPVDEAEPSGRGFLAELTRAWEDAALAVRDAGVRVVLPRIGVVLGPEGGAWPALRRAIASGLGGALGDGTQVVPWIHLDDVVEALALSLVEPSWHGPVNLTAPGVVTNAQLSQAVAERLGRTLGLPVPSWLLRLVLGERASVVLDGQRAVPRFLVAREFPFRHRDIGSAVDSLLALERSVSIAATSARARHTLSQVTELDAGIDEVFDYFSRPQNLGPMTPAWTEFRILGPAPERVEAGTTIDYRLKLGPVPVRWRTRIARWQPGSAFVDEQARGPYRLWWHEHRFEGDGGRTRMTDTVHYTLPLGPIGRLVHRFVVARTLRRIFGFRRAAMGHRFGVVDREMSRAA